MEINTYLGELSTTITTFGIIVVLEIAFFGLLAVLHLYRQAAALKRTAEIEEQRNSFLIRSRREKLASEISIEDPLSWMSKTISKRLEYPVNLFSKSFFLADTGLIVCLTGDGKTVAASSHRPKDLERSLKRLTSNGKGMDRGEVEAAYSIIRGAKSYRVALVDRDTSDFFDLEMKKAGDTLNVDWSNSDELWFYLGATQKSIA